MFETLKYEIKDNIAYITVNRPEALNAINTTVLRDLKAAFDKVNDDPEVKVVILTGEGKAFVQQAVQVRRVFAEQVAADVFGN